MLPFLLTSYDIAVQCNNISKKWVYIYIFFFFLFLVTTVEVSMPNITVSEENSEVEICFDLSTGITEQVIVTAVTRPKSGAANPATGKSDYITSGQTVLFILTTQYPANSDY